ncbi:carboxylic acid reductase [Rhodococcus spongiicola]|uniref:Carboxylic acid reductase n=1 Tax=Rhodococcus spongiicola TaxID=2487352 RepID=A0A438AUV2_9NOCA|nr:carboxylic acid reductase [Rhodococcus spongiicola]RVW02439.1 NAD-dependent epimerase/dehydratase family protein [Rhodococcus spongiicola]
MTTDTSQDARFAGRVSELYATDPQFRAAAPLPDVIAAAHEPGLRLAEVVDAYLDGYADRPALGRRSRTLTRDADGHTITTLLPSFDTITYRELRDRVATLASAWRTEAGIAPGDFVAVLGFTSIDYAVVYLTCLRLGAVFVPLQSSTPAARLAPIVAETSPRILAAGIDSIDTAVDVTADAQSIERLVILDYDARDDEQRRHYEAARARVAHSGHAVEVGPLSDDVDIGEALPLVPPFVAPAGDDPLASLIYTSGSTGAPKGAIYTADMMTRMWVQPPNPIEGFDGKLPAIYLQYMPLSHIFGLGWLTTTLASGGTGYFAAKSDMSTLFDDLSLIRPTALNLVPRVCDMIFRRYCSEMDGRPGDDGDSAGVKRALRDDVLGGRVLAALCGTAPLSDEMREFVESTLEIPITTSYGATETAVSVLRNGTIMRPQVTDYKLVDVPELEYYTTDLPHPRGELLVKCDTMIPGYYKHPEMSADIFDRDGFYRTGDIMEEIAPDHLIYLERRKNVLKLSQGEFVAVSTLEAAYATCPHVRQIFLYGSSERSFLLAVIVPNPGGTSDGDLHALITAELRHVAQMNSLNPYEIPRDFLIESEPFSPDNGLLSGVGKLLRPALKARYGERLERMYAEIAEGLGAELEQLRADAATLPTLTTVRRAAAATLGLSTASELPDDARFVDLGGDSLSAFSFSNLLEKLFNLEVPVQSITGPSADLESISHYLDRERLETSTRPTFESVHGRDADVIRATDLELGKFIDAATLAAAPSLPAPSGTVRTVLMTGATGYLGRFLCLSWLERLAQVDGKLICIARGDDAEAARQRIEEAIDSGDAELSQHFRALADRHLEVLAGDLAEEDLGLDTETWDLLARSVDLIVHCAALVNHVLPYRQLFGPNVVGTAEIVKLALSTRLKPVNYISTVAFTILPDGGSMGEDEDARQAGPVRPLDDSYANGYKNSKWAGEVLLREAHDLCGLPVAVFRPAMTLAHSRYAGQLNVHDRFTRLLFSIVLTGLAPRSFYRLDAEGNPPRAHFEGLPADFTAEAIATLGADVMSGFHAYNVLNTYDDGISLDRIVDWLIEAGHNIERIDDYDEWLRRFRSAMESLPAEPRRRSVLRLLDAYTAPAPPTSRVPSAEGFRAAVQSAGIGSTGDVPHVTSSLINKYVDDLQQLGRLDDDR